MQKSDLKCVDARHFIHLSVGDDTLPDEEQQLAEHLHVCSDCRAYHAGTMDAMHAIERVRDADVADSRTASVWPTLSNQLKARLNVPAEPRRRTFNGAVVALCACSLMLALVTAIQNLPTNDVSPYADLSIAPTAVNVSLKNGQPQQQTTQRQLIPMATPNGSLVLIDPESGRRYVPDLLNGQAADQNLEF